MRPKRKPSLASSGIIPVNSNVFDKQEPPLTGKQRDAERSRVVDEFLTDCKKRRDAMFAEFIEECRWDPRFLDRALKELKPLRGRGHSKRPRWHVSAAESITSNLSGAPGWRVGEIVTAIAQTLMVSEPTARRLYDAARKRRK